MGQLVFQATLGGAVNLIGPNTAATVNFTLPSADGTNGQSLTTNGSGTLAFTTVTTAPGGSTTQVQYNNAGVFAGSANMTFNGTTLTVNDITDSSLTSGRVVYAGTAGNLTSSANLLYSGTDLTVYGLTVGRGAGAVSSNTAVGASALAANSTGERNIGVGSQALTANSTGVRNTVVGTFSYNGATACNYVTSLGHAAGNSATGDYNTFIGESAGGSMSSGTKNTILGRYNGNQGSLDIRTGSNYVVLSDGDGNPVAYTYNGATFCLQGAGYPQSGTGITFPATQSASSNANTLDDYEEGTWTPVLARTGSNYTFSFQAGSYVKIGSLVTCSFSINISAITTQGSTYNTLSGLPFTPKNQFSGNLRYTGSLAIKAPLTSANSFYYSGAFFFNDGTSALQVNFTTGEMFGVITFEV